MVWKSYCAVFDLRGKIVLLLVYFAMPLNYYRIIFGNANVPKTVSIISRNDNIGWQLPTLRRDQGLQFLVSPPSPPTMLPWELNWILLTSHMRDCACNRALILCLLAYLFHFIITTTTKLHHYGRVAVLYLGNIIQYNIILLSKLSERNLNKVESYRR